MQKLHKIVCSFCEKRLDFGRGLWHTLSMELVQGKQYRIRLTDGHWTTGEYRYTKHHEANWYYKRATTHYIFVNVATGRVIEIKSMVRIHAISAS